MKIQSAVLNTLINVAALLVVSDGVDSCCLQQLN